MHKILVIDDHAPTRMIFSRILGKQGYQVIQADNGLEGCEKATSENPDLILLDVMMPEMGGFEALGKLKADPITRPIPVMMLTYRDMPYDLASAFAMGASGYIIKPVVPDDLSDSVGRVLSSVDTQIHIDS